MPELNEKIFLVLDIGTSYIKCGSVDSEYNITTQYQREFPMTQSQFAFEIDFDLFFNTTNDLLKECLADQVVKRSTIEALLITSQAQTFAAVDADFSPIHTGIVWLDERAEKEADYLKEQLPDFARTAGFTHPLPSLYVSKLLWLKRNEPGVFKKARTFPLINEYLVYKLTGAFYSDSTSFGMGGMYDFSRNSMNTHLLQILGLTKDCFPAFDHAAMRGVFISKQIQEEWNLNYRFPVFLCGNDQGASACGAGLKQPGDVNINFGTAMVFYTITESLTTNLTKDQIAGKHPVGDAYFLLNFESDFGMRIRRLKDSFMKQGTYDQLFQTYNQYPDVGAQAPFSADAVLNSVSPADSHRLCAGVIKHYLARLKAHFAQIRQVVALKNIFLSGGITQSEVWLKILRDTLNQPFTINNRTNAGLFGAIDIYLHRRNRRNGDD